MHSKEDPAWPKEIITLNTFSTFRQGIDLPLLTRTLAYELHGSCVWNQLRSQLYQQQVTLILHGTLAASQKVNLSMERGMRRLESLKKTKQNKKALDEQKYKHSFQSFQMFSFTDRKRSDFTFEADCSSILRNPTMAISVV